MAHAIQYSVLRTVTPLAVDGTKNDTNIAKLSGMIQRANFRDISRITSPW